MAKEKVSKKENQTNWISLLGKIQTQNGKLKYLPQISTEGPNQGSIPPCIAKSNISFDSGSIEFDVTLKTSDSKCQVILSQGFPVETFVGLNLGASAYGIMNYSGSKWEHVITAGDPGTLPLNEPIHMKIMVKGSVVDLYINGVKAVGATTLQLAKSQIALLMGGSSEITVEKFLIQTLEPRAFVVMQFSQEFNELYEEVIKPTCERFGLSVIRADDIFNNTLVLEDIVKSIQEASVIIADISVDNPNVFYEVGFAHAINKPTILLSDKRRIKLPFDLSGFRTLFYENSIGGKREVEQKLLRHLENLSI